MAKLSKKERKQNLEHTKEVRTKDELIEAADSWYGRIIVKGKILDEIETTVRKNRIANGANNVCTIVGLVAFWPLLIVGLVGSSFTASLAKYRVHDEDGTIVLVRK